MRLGGLCFWFCVPRAGRPPANTGVSLIIPLRGNQWPQNGTMAQVRALSSPFAHPAVSRDAVLHDMVQRLWEQTLLARALAIQLEKEGQTALVSRLQGLAGLGDTLLLAFHVQPTAATATRALLEAALNALHELHVEARATAYDASGLFEIPLAVRLGQITQSPLMPAASRALVQEVYASASLERPVNLAGPWLGKLTTVTWPTTAREFAGDLVSTSRVLHQIARNRRGADGPGGSCAALPGSLDPPRGRHETVALTRPPIGRPPFAKPVGNNVKVAGGEQGMGNKVRPRCPDCGFAMAPIHAKGPMGALRPVRDFFICREDKVVAYGRRKDKVEFW